MTTQIINDYQELNRESSFKLPHRLANIPIANYSNNFNFFFVTPINEIIFHQKHTKSYKQYKEVLKLQSQSDFIQKCYTLENTSQQYSISENLYFLTNFYQANQPLITHQYPTMIITNTKTIFQHMLRRKHKMTAANDTENQFYRKKTILKEGSGNFELFADYQQVSFSNKSRYIKDTLNADVSQQQCPLTIHNIYEQNQYVEQMEIKWIIDQNTIEDQVKHLMCDFEDLDQNNVIKQYQLIQLKKRKRNQNNENSQNPQSNASMQAKVNPLKQMLGMEGLRKSGNIAKIQKSKRKQQDGSRRSKDSIEIRINITGGTRDSQQQSNQYFNIQPRSSKQGRRQKIKISSNIYNRGQNLLKSKDLNWQSQISSSVERRKTQHEYWDMERRQSRQRKLNNRQYYLQKRQSKQKKRIQNEFKRYCLNLNTKEIYQKQQQQEKNKRIKDDYNLKNTLQQIKARFRNQPPRRSFQQPQYIKQSQYIKIVEDDDQKMEDPGYWKGAHLIQSTVIKGQLVEERNQSMFSFGNPQNHQQTDYIHIFEDDCEKPPPKLSLNKKYPFHKVYKHLLTDESNHKQSNSKAKAEIQYQENKQLKFKR